MQRILRRGWDRLNSRRRNATTEWDRFWFAPVDPALTGIIRICTGLMLVYTHAVWGLELGAFFGSNGWIPPDALRAVQDGQLAWSFWWWIPDAWMWPAHLFSLVILTLFTIGLWTRATAALSFGIVVSYVHRATPALFGLDQINALLTLYLAIGYLGTPVLSRALSADRYLRLRKSSRLTGGLQNAPLPPSAAANLTLRLIQVHMCVIYFFAGISKLQGPAWWDGQAMWLAFANLEYQSSDMTWLADWPILVNLMTHTTVLWEISFAFLIWRPALRPVMLAVSIPLHLGIGAFLGMWTFGLIMLVGCASFLSPPIVARAVDAAVHWFNHDPSEAQNETRNATA